MINSLERKNRLYAADLARKYFSGQISMHQFLNNLLDYQNDIKIRFLIDKVEKRPKKGWFFDVSRERNTAYIKEVFIIIEDLENSDV